MASETITLFTQQNDFGPRPTSFAASIVLHVLTLSVVLFGLAYKPRVANVITEHYSMRELDLHLDEQEMRAVRNLMPPPAPHPSPRELASAANSSASRPVPPPMTEAKRGPQTLLQPDLPKPITLLEPLPLPQVVIWSPSKTIVRKVVPPLPEKPTAANVKPNVERPNEEMNLADVNISSSFHPSAKSIIAPSTTSPVAIPLPQQVQLPPVTTSQPTAQPTPAAIVSLSDLRMNNGTVPLPPVNESAMSTSQGMLAPNQMRDLSLPAKEIPLGNPGEGAGSGTGSGKTNGAANGAGQSSAGPANKAGASAGQGAQSKANGPATASGTPNASNSTQGSQSGSDQNAQLTSTQITLPKDGRFGAVVVGDSLQDQFPEVTGVWGARMAYTVYLHVGLAHNWIMQYALPRASDAANAGTVIRLDAPWPYSIVRPNLDPDSVNADAIMIHGFIDQSGRFEKLSMIVPPTFPQAQFVLAALAKWQFRPALQDGQSTRVEVLIIIPEQLD
jgi:hypothetical protein